MQSLQLDPGGLIGSYMLQAGLASALTVFSARPAPDSMLAISMQSSQLDPDDPKGSYMLQAGAHFCIEILSYPPSS